MVGYQRKHIAANKRYNLCIGVFLVGTVIILNFTYKSFILYMIVNAITDAGLSFGLSKWYEHLGIYKLVKINSFGVYAVTLIVAVLIYFYQKWQDTVFVDTTKYK
jgi:hypothetical protein